jgi:cell division cycle 20-like protein 1 (cofactor of APC complex)
MSKLVSWDEHQAAVKAIGFNPNEPTITSGAGTADRKLRVFSLNTLKLINEVDTGSQICNLLYSPVSN